MVPRPRTLAVGSLPPCPRRNQTDKANDRHGNEDPPNHLLIVPQIGTPQEEYEETPAFSGTTASRPKRLFRFAWKADGLGELVEALGHPGAERFGSGEWRPVGLGPGQYRVGLRAGLQTGI